ncbi:MAG: hypothetical protein U1C97_02580 [Candidatus Gracilibacteria bacterium]|nr:hypothetical protein [bacterium]MDZ4217181.1 hypothetical protein [Candidatus Gracilibacteria bacterium]
MIKKLSFLQPGVGNNAFSFSRKPDRKPLQITPLRQGSLDELRVGKHIAFQDFNGDEWVECVGLESAILCLDFPIPIYVFDNHNYVFYAWAEARKNAKCKMKNEKGADYWSWSDRMTLIHMDEHFDAAVPLNVQVDLNDLNDVWRYTNEVLQIATYIKPALELGIFSGCLNFVESRHFEHLAPVSGDVVMNIDLDVFCDEMNHISWKQKIDVLRYYLPQMKLMTVATSPFFIDQENAILILHRLILELFGDVL